MDIGKVGYNIIDAASKKINEAPAPAKVVEVVEGGSEAIMKKLDAAASLGKSMVKIPSSLDDARKQLLERLNKLNIETAPNRSKYDSERFGKDGIDSIMELATTKKDIDLVNLKLDELERGKDIWTYDITKELPGSFDKFSLGPFSEVFDDIQPKKLDPIIDTILTKKSSIPEVIELEKKMQDMGYSVNFSDSTDAARTITNAYEKLTQKGFKMPYEIQLMIPAKEGVLGYRPYAKPGFEFETPIVLSRDLTREQVDMPSSFRDMGIEHNVSQTPESVIYHEIGHFLHELNEPSMETMSSTWKKYASGGYDLDLAKEVGYYAMTGDRFNMGREFVAEVFAGLMEGKQFSERVMDIYTRLGGTLV